MVTRMLAPPCKNVFSFSISLPVSSQSSASAVASPVVTRITFFPSASIRFSPCMFLPGRLSFCVMLTETVIFSFSVSPSAVQSFLWFTLSIM